MLLFPLPEPPADVVDELLTELRAARRELTDAGRIVSMLAIEPSAAEHARRLWVEQQTAEHRAQLWAATVASLENKARGLGLDVSSQL
jgi:hypothetical protein